MIDFDSFLVYTHIKTDLEISKVYQHFLNIGLKSVAIRTLTFFRKYFISALRIFFIHILKKTFWLLKLNL